jgi:hypothetical protein
MLREAKHPAVRIAGGHGHSETCLLAGRFFAAVNGGSE